MLTYCISGLVGGNLGVLGSSSSPTVTKECWPSIARHCSFERKTGNLDFKVNSPDS